MPVILPITMPAPISSQWTHEILVSHLRLIMDELDNRVLQDSHIRVHINAAITTLFSTMKTIRDPYYGMVLQATPDPVTQSGFLGPQVGQCIDLSILTSPNVILWTDRLGNPVALDTASPMGRYATPASLLFEVYRVGYTYQATQAGTPTPFLSKEINCHKRSMEELLYLQSDSNMQFDYEVAWHHYGNLIYLFVGSAFANPATSTPAPNIPWIPNRYYIHGYRNPILDDLLPPDRSFTWRRPVDVPDAYLNAVVTQAQKRCLEQMGKQSRPDLDYVTQNLAQNIIQQSAAATQEEAAERKKMNYGLETR